MGNLLLFFELQRSLRRGKVSFGQMLYSPVMFVLMTMVFYYFFLGGYCIGRVVGVCIAIPSYS